MSRSPVVEVSLLVRQADRTHSLSLGQGHQGYGAVNISPVVEVNLVRQADRTHSLAPGEVTGQGHQGKVIVQGGGVVVGMLLEADWGHTGGGKRSAVKQAHGSNSFVEVN